LKNAYQNRLVALRNPEERADGVS